MMVDSTGEAATAEKAPGGASRDIVVNARFRPDGLVDAITHRPEPLSPQEWFDRLCCAVPQSYQPLAGGRGAFRIAGALLEALQREPITAGRSLP
jgi:hypothetical protein